eukprot:2526755-Amphidinium_carterae.4
MAVHKSHDFEEVKLHTHPLGQVYRQSVPTRKTAESWHGKEHFGTTILSGSPPPCRDKNIQ